MAKLFTKLTEEFEAHTGALIGYLDAAGAAITPRYHYDLRSFHADDITVPRTMLDMNYWNATSFNGTQMAVIDAPRIVQGRSIAARQMSEVNILTNIQLNQLIMSDLDLFTVTAGNESWTGTGITLAKDSSDRYANLLSVPLVDAVSKTVTSVYRDNLLADFNEAGHSYFIEFVLPGLTRASTNLVLNGGFETNTTGYTQLGTATLTRDTVTFHDGTAALKVVTTAASGSGATHNSTGAANGTAGTTYTLSAWIFYPNGQAGTLSMDWRNGTTFLSDITQTFTGTGAWQRVSVTGVAPTNTTKLRMNVFTNTGTITTFYVDGVQIEAQATPTPYIETNGAIASNAGGLDLPNSFIDFTSDAGYAAGSTDTFAFNASLNPISDGNTYFRINRNLLTHADLSNLAGIRFRLKSVGAYTAKIQSMRLVREDYTWQVVDIDSKRNTFRRSLPRDSGTEPGAPTSIYMTPTKPKNGMLVAKFNSGHLDASNANVLTLSGRKNPTVDTRVRASVSSLSGSTTLTVAHIITGTLTTLNTASLGALSAEKDYFLVLEFYENQVRASIYNAFGAFFGSLVGATSWQTTTVLGRGYIGFNSQPYNYDFTVDYVTMGDAEFARYEGTNFGSFTPVMGATVAGGTSLPVDLGAGHYIIAGDATSVIEPLFGTPAPAIHFTRDGTGWQGGYMTDSFLFIGNPKYLTVGGDIYPILATGQTALRGEYRVVLIDKYDAVGYIGVIRGLLPNQWNSFKLRINANFAPGSYRMIIQQTGFYADQFYLDNLALEHLSVAWEASPNGGTNWYPFLTAVNDRYSGVNMIPNANQNLKMRAIALSDTAWVSDFETIPKYGYPGRKP